MTFDSSQSLLISVTLQGSSTFELENLESVCLRWSLFSKLYSFTLNFPIYLPFAPLVFSTLLKLTHQEVLSVLRFDWILED